MSRQEFTVRQEGDRVLFIVNGVCVANMPPGAAREVAAVIAYQAGRAEEIAQRERIVLDEAILLRAGMPVGLIHHPYLRHQAEIEAQHNTIIRRSNMGSITSTEHFGVPALVAHPPRREGPDGSGF